MSEKNDGQDRRAAADPDLDLGYAVFCGCGARVAPEQARHSRREYGEPVCPTCEMSFAPWVEQLIADREERP